MSDLSAGRCVRIIESCKTRDQCNTARRYVKLWANRTSDFTSAAALLTMLVDRYYTIWKKELGLVRP